MARVIHFPIHTMQLFGDQPSDGEVWINPDQVTRIERVSPKMTAISLSDGSSHTVSGTPEEAIRKSS